MALVAAPHCCEEASLLSRSFYLPCNAPAVSIVGWKGRDEKPIRMCAACADHNIKNRSGKLIGPYMGEYGEAVVKNRRR